MVEAKVIYKVEAQGTGDIIQLKIHVHEILIIQLLLARTLTGW